MLISWKIPAKTRDRQTNAIFLVFRNRLPIRQVSVGQKLRKSNCRTGIGVTWCVRNVNHAFPETDIHSFDPFSLYIMLFQWLHTVQHAFHSDELGSSTSNDYNFLNNGPIWTGQRRAYRAWAKDHFKQKIFFSISYRYRATSVRSRKSHLGRNQQDFHSDEQGSSTSNDHNFVNNGPILTLLVPKERSWSQL